MPKPLRELNGRPEIASPGQLKWQKKEKLGIRLCLVNASRLVKFHEWTPQRNWRSQKVKKVELGEEQQPHVKSHMKSQCTEIEASSSWPVKCVQNSKIARSQPRNRRKIAPRAAKWRKLYPECVLLPPAYIHLTCTRLLLMNEKLFVLPLPLSQSRVENGKVGKLPPMSL